MNIQLMQISLIGIYIALAVLAWKVDVKAVRWSAVTLIIVIFTMNPLRFKQTGGESLEREAARFEDIPEKVIVVEEKFEDSQNRELSNLKNQSRGLKDEIHK